METITTQVVYQQQGLSVFLIEAAMLKGVPGAVWGTVGWMDVTLALSHFAGP